MIKNIAIDAGSGRTKATDNDQWFNFPSLTANFTQVLYVTGMESDEDPTAHLVLECEGYRWFVGSAAAKQGIAQRTVDRERAVNEEGKLLTLAALGLLSDGDTQRYNIVTGLPVSHYSGLQERFLETMKKTHNYSFVSVTGKSKKDFVAEVDDIKIIPQPIGTLMDCVLDDRGNIANPDLARQNVGIIDVGYFTADVVRADSLEFIGQSSTSYPLGLFNAYTELSEGFNSAFGIEAAPETLETVMDTGKIVIRGKTHDVTEIRDHALDVAAKQIISRVKTIWSKTGWQIDKVIITGGGGSVLYEHLDKAFEGSTELAKEPFYANVNGYMKLACKTWNEEF